MSRNLRNIVKNFSALAFGRLLAGVFNVLTLLLIAKMLGASNFGIYTLALTLGSLYGAVATFGMGGLATREIARNPLEAPTYLLNGSLTIVIIGAPLFVLASWYLAQAYPENHLVLLWGIGVAISKIALDYMGSILFGMNQVPRAAFFNTLQATGSSVLALGLLQLGKASLTQVFQAQMLWSLVLVFVLTKYMRELLGMPSLRAIDLRTAGQLLKRSVPFGIFALGSLLYFYMDTLMLGSMVGVAEVGYFQAALRIVLAIDVFPVLMASSIYPVISTLFIKDPTSFSIIGRLILRYMLAIALPIAIACSLLAPFLTLFLFGTSFAPSAPLLAVLAWLIPIRFGGHILGIMLSAGDQQAGRAVATVVATILNLGINLILIPHWGALGAAFASLLTSGGLIVFYATSLSKQTSHLGLLSEVGRLVVPGVAMVATTEILRPHGLAMAVAAAIFAYVIACLASGAIRLREIRTLLNILRRKEFSFGIH